MFRAAANRFHHRKRWSGNYQERNKHKKAENKINVHQNKSKIPNREKRRPNNCITEKYLQNDKHKKKRKRIVPDNRNYADITTFGEKNLLSGTVTYRKLKEIN